MISAAGRCEVGPLTIVSGTKERLLRVRYGKPAEYVNEDGKRVCPIHRDDLNADEALAKTGVEPYASEVET